MPPNKSSEKSADATSAASNAADGAGQPAEPLRESLRGLSDALVQRTSHAVSSRIESTTKNLAKRAGDATGLGSGVEDITEGKPLKAVTKMGASRLTEKVKDTVKGLTGGGRGSSARGKLKVTNIVESLDVGVPVKVAYDQWTRFTEFPSFMKKVENVEQKSEEKLAWTAQILWSHRRWESKIVEQVPDERIVWTSKGDKGYVNGAVSFHELAPSLTRITVVLMYYPKGLFEHMGNMFRAQGRRARLELKHFQRHVMTETILHADELEGWRGEIHDGKVAQSAEPENGEDSNDENENEDSGRREGSDKGEEAEQGEKPKRARAQRGPAPKTRRRADAADDKRDQDRPTGRQQRPERSRAGRSAGKAGAS